MQNFEFPRQSRLLTAGDFRSVFDKAEIKISNRNFLLLARRNNLQTARIGFVLSKKNIKLAVDRNRIKRLTRESFRLQHKSIPSVDIVFLGRKGIVELDNATFKYQFEGAIKKLISKSKRLD